MSHNSRHTWAVVLAAGEGTRLAALTTDSEGNAVPKQFCSFHDDNSLLQDAMQRALRVVAPERLCVIVAEHHRKYWRRALRALPAGNTIVQPRNCGTSNGVLLATLQVLELDPQARILFLPADHYVRNEVALGESLCETADLLATNVHADELFLVGIDPEEADPELGYIEPGLPDANGTRSVARFIEKPTVADARDLITRGTLWNSFIFGALGTTLVSLIGRRTPRIVDAMANAFAAHRGARARAEALAELYEDLPVIDFSRSVLEGAAQQLRVIRAPACGWSDLGTPRRVAQTLARIEPRVVPLRRTVLPGSAYINLAVQHLRLSAAG
jgi:mannose-1-phosphate guanylyltransferase